MPERILCHELQTLLSRSMPSNGYYAKDCRQSVDARPAAIESGPAAVYGARGGQTGGNALDHGFEPAFTARPGSSAAHGLLVERARDRRSRR